MFTTEMKVALIARIIKNEGNVLADINVTEYVEGLPEDFRLSIVELIEKYSKPDYNNRIFDCQGLSEMVTKNDDIIQIYYIPTTMRPNDEAAHRWQWRSRKYDCYGNVCSNYRNDLYVVLEIIAESGSLLENMHQEVDRIREEYGFHDWEDDVSGCNPIGGDECPRCGGSDWDNGRADLEDFVSSGCIAHECSECGLEIESSFNIRFNNSEVV